MFPLELCVLRKVSFMGEIYGVLAEPFGAPLRCSCCNYLHNYWGVSPNKHSGSHFWVSLRQLCHFQSWACLLIYSVQCVVWPEVWLVLALPPGFQTPPHCLIHRSAPICVFICATLEDMCSFEVKYGLITLVPSCP